jgi:hypothetical protein
MPPARALQRRVVSLEQITNIIRYRKTVAAGGLKPQEVPGSMMAARVNFGAYHLKCDQ